MNKVFFVTGIPRANGAWFSVFLSTDKTHCYYEPLRDLWKITDLDSRLESDFYTHVGCMDSALAFFLDDLVDVYKARVLVLERDVLEVESMLAAAGMPKNNYCRLVKERLDRYRGHPDFMYMPFHLTRDGRAMQKAFWHCLPGVPFDEERWRLLSQVDIEPTKRHVLGRIDRDRRHLGRLLQDVIEKEVTVEV